ncbi:14429_t:CDS:2 [Ambispora leptoticha]|uniref:14429_t:CDS:1 n=1 Tax=Ambispora leptoticha TaxID=144679 RepID=A0A9N9BMH8_9GLOM|nr:14429_t:CDS:2 [Ambispora leptoticha]
MPTTISPRSSTSSISERDITNSIEIEDNFDVNLTNGDSTTRLHNVNNKSLTTLSNSQVESNIASIRGKNKTIQIILLTTFMVGVSFTWSVELAFGTPYLLSLGLSKSFTSLVWIAGPLSGLIMQPIVGILSDNCTSIYGRRRPFILGGSIAVIFSFMFIGWTIEIVTAIFGKNSFSVALTVWVAVISIYMLDFAINAVQACVRALIVDSLPPSQQEAGTAWAGRMSGIGSVVGYFMGFVDLVAIFPFFGDTQLKVMCVLASLILIACNIITWYSVDEVVYHSKKSQHVKNVFVSTFETLASIVRSIRYLPTPAQRICNVLLFAWIGWFPFLFYSTTWVAELYKKSHAADNSLPLENSQDPVGNATRSGSYALLVHSLVNLVSSFVLPFVVSPSGSEIMYNASNLSWRSYFRLPLPGLTLPKLWTISNFIMAFAMLSTWFVTTVSQATFLFGILGIAWAVSAWAPFSILAEFISRETRNAISNTNDIPHTLIPRVHDNDDNATESDQVAYRLVDTNNTTTAINTDEGDDVELLNPSSSKSSSSPPPSSSIDAGILLGIQNIYIVIPQFLVTLFSSLVFAILEPSSGAGDILDMGEENNSDIKILPTTPTTKGDAIGFVLRFGGLMAIIAGILSIKVWK